MKLFACSNCRNVVYFNNTVCESCGFRLGYDSPKNAIYALTEGGGGWIATAFPRRQFRFCANAEHDACNWLIPANRDGPLCAACRHNRTIPDLSVEENLPRWRKLEAARHHLFYSLLRLGLPLETRAQSPDSGLAFDVLADDPISGVQVTTGHSEGVITVNLAEADDAIREQRRTELHEPYRTLLGHFRHEIGHYYWNRLVRDAGRVAAFREVFGDETRDYDESLKSHYADGPPADWRDNFITAYASAHPWEDFAEIWAHYFHITDTMEMARSHGVRTTPRGAKLIGVRLIGAPNPSPCTAIGFDPYYAQEIEQLINCWHPVVIAVNSINRCMGQPDLYPFVLTPPIIRKLGFVHELAHITPGQPGPTRGKARETVAMASPGPVP
jgi:hypothetical protein